MSAPARLLSVRLQGFKSFADRTHVAFGPGISAVVGPNGSGKSNLADALRWALGEQGRALRSRKAEDVIWAGSEKRPAVGLADVQLTLDNEDALLPVEYGVVELGRRLYRSGENDYLLNRQRVRLKDLVDLLDAGHLAENAFLFIGQGMVDQALALRPEERRPLFEEVAGVRRHERRRRRAEEQLAESESNLARVDDILAELRPQARRLAQQAEQQANRLSAADELASAILLSAHARWHEAGGRSVRSSAAVAGSRRRADEAMAELLGHEQAMTAASAVLGNQATEEAAARSELDRRRAERATLQLREARHASEIEAAARERVRLAETRRAAETELAAARDTLALPLAASPADLEAELARLDAEIAAVGSSGRGVEAATEGLSAVDAAAVRRLEAARAQEAEASRRRAAEAERRAAEERTRAIAAQERAATTAEARAAAARDLEARLAEEAASIAGRETAAAALAEAERTARSVADRIATAEATAASTQARLDEARRAVEAAEGAAFSRAARARGGRSMADGLIVEPSLRAAVDAALSGIGRAHVLPRRAIAEVAGERGTAIAAEAIAAPGSLVAAEAAFVDGIRARGGGRLVDALRRDDSGAATRLLSRAVWLPDAGAALDAQSQLPPGWLAVARDGSLVVAQIAVWLQPDARGVGAQADIEHMAAEAAGARDAVVAATQARSAATAALDAARRQLVSAREAEAVAASARRRAEELDRSAAAAAESATREHAWLAAQVTHLESEAARLRAGLPPDPEPAAKAGEAGHDASGGPDDALALAERQLADLQRRRRELVEEVEAARATRRDTERRRAQADAALSLAERQLQAAAQATADLAEREGRLQVERDEVAGLLAGAEHDVGVAEAALAAVVEAAASERARLREAESKVSAARERLRVAQERTRLDEREDVEARLALEGLREQLLVELAGLGAVALRHLGVPPSRHAGDEGAAPGAEAVGDDQSDDLDPDDLERALATATEAWLATPPPGDPPAPGRLASLRRRFHDLGAVNPFAADEYAEVKARLDGLEGQRSDLQAAIDHTRDLIRQLDSMIGEQFRRTFAALERAFDARFQQLFGGGFARLALTDPQDLAATGIEITARPPGKKPQALAMLSGGERALTAVALLFAMLEVRPVPFCVLDEVDAALDEANIGRFTDALRELSRTTQCIVITHNRGTIETADALYGVTVGDDSVSRVISLRLDEATALAERAAEPVAAAAGG
ncbi:MAG TPA: chromosome segregation protein SMC [Patescibacteria group bacterium]|nr:chromosome segregation protein SMC [Patescibacteria group bacterium]